MRAILVRLPNWVGDAAMSLPALAAAVPAIGIGFTVPARGGSGWRALIRRLRAEAYDLGILFTPSFSSALVLTLAGVRQRVGRRGQGRDWLLSSSLPAGRYACLSAIGPATVVDALARQADRSAVIA